MLMLAMTIVLVAAIMVAGLKELELDLALGAARMAGTDFTAMNAKYTLGKIDFALNEAGNTVEVTPHFYLHGLGVITNSDWLDARATCFFKMRSVFRPDDSGLNQDYCFDAPYRRYCITPVMTNA